MGERMFWGTDITRMPCPWRQCVTVFTEELPWLEGRDKELVMGEAMCNLVAWSRLARVRAGTGEPTPSALRIRIRIPDSLADGLRRFLGSDRLSPR